MKIGLIGTIMYDQITSAEGNVFESFGGILYNLMALAAVASREDELVPVAWLSEEHLVRLRREYLDRIPMVDSRALRINAAGTDYNRLFYLTASSRTEVMKVVAPAIGGEMLSPIRDADGLLVNFISGHEMDWENFQTLRSLVRGPIYLDAHNLGKKRVNGVPVPGHRFDDWAKWFSAVDIVQANEWEALRLFGFHPKTEEQYREAVLRFLSVDSLRVGILTLGGQGCAMAWREDGEVRFTRIPAMPDLEVVDTTGCGDCFSAGFLVEYLRTNCPLRSAVFASTVSSMNCAQKGLDGLAKIGGVREMMHLEYAPLLEKIDGGWRGEKA